MPDIFTLKAILGLDSSEYKKGLDDAKDEAEKSGGGIGKALGTAAKVGAAALAAATGAAVAFGKSAVEAGMTFDSSMSQVAATMGYSVEELNTKGSEAAETLNKLRDFAQKMGSETAFSASQAADALNYMALAGYDAETSINMLPNVLNLAAAGGMELATASDMVTDASSALGLSLEDTARLVDQMAVSSSKSNTSVAQLGEAILTVGGTAKNLAGGTTELSTALGILADNGIKGAEGGTALRNVILALSAPTDKAWESLQKLGVSAYDDNQELRPLEDTFADLNAALEPLTQEERTNVLNEIFNKVDLKSANALLATSSDRWAELSGAIDDASGAAAKMAATQLDNLQGDLTLMQSAAEGLKIAVSDGLTPSLREFVQFGASGLSRLTSAFKEGGLSGAMEELGSILSDAVNMIAEKLPEIVEAGAGLLKALVKGIIDNIPTLIDAVFEIIQVLVTELVTPENVTALINAAYQIVTSLIKGITENIDMIIKAAVDILIAFTTAWYDPQNITMLVDAAIELLMALTDALIDNLPVLIDAAPKIIMGIVQALVDNAPKLFEAGLEVIIKLVEGIIDNLPALGKACGEIIGAVLKGLADIFVKMVEIGQRLVQGIHDGIHEKWEWLKQKVKGFVDNFVNAFKNLLGIHSPSTVFKGFGNSLVQGLMDGLKEKWENLKTLISNIGNSIRDGIKEKLDAAKEWGRDMMQNLSSGISNAWNNVKGAVTNVAQRIANRIAFSEPKEGPLSNFLTYAPDMMKLFAQGIMQNKRLITDAIDRTFDFNPSYAMAGTANYTVRTSSRDEADRRELIAALRDLRGLKVVMDTGETVGVLSKPMNSALGNQYVYRKRGVV